MTVHQAGENQTTFGVNDFDSFYRRHISGSHMGNTITANPINPFSRIEFLESMVKMVHFL